MRLNDLINQELGRYRIEALIGRGGMAAVYRAFDTRLQRYVALKVLYPQYLADDDIVERFRREAITAAQLDHPYIAPIYDVGEANGLIYLAMKLLPGPSLAEVLQREQRLDPQRALVLISQIASALDEAHQRGIIHRDIKPGNVLFDDRGQAILTDFGIAKSLDAPSLTETSVIVGTPDYIAPEQIDPRLAPNGKIDHRADLYALGAMLYRVLTGRRPFDGSAQTVLLAHLRDEPPLPSTIVPTLPPSIDAVISRAMAKQPEARFDSAGVLAQALGNALGDKTEVGVVFPPAALRSEAYTRPTTQALLYPVSSTRVPVLPPLAPPEDAPAEPPITPTVRRRWLVPLLISLLLLGVGAAGTPLVAQFIGAGRADRPSSAIAAGNTTETAVTVSSATTARTATSSPTTQPSATTTGTATASPTSEPSVTPQPSVTNTVAPAPPASGGTGVQPRATARPTSVPTPRPTARPTVRPTSAPQPTAQPTAQPTPAPAPTDPPAQAQCEIELAGGFGYLWRSNKAVRDALGCPQEAERAGWSAEQLFQGGAMYYRDDSKQFWVFANSGSWRLHTDVYESDPEPTEEPPPGLFAPVRGFGRLWQKYPSIREALGWGTTGEQGFNGVVERFAHGTMLYSTAVNGHSARIYVLYNNGTYAIFRDSYDGP